MNTFFHGKRKILILNCFPVIFFFLSPFYFYFFFVQSCFSNQPKLTNSCSQWADVLFGKESPALPSSTFSKVGKEIIYRAALDTGMKSYPTSAPSRLEWQIGHKPLGRQIKNLFLWGSHNTAARWQKVTSTDSVPNVLWKPGIWYKKRRTWPVFPAH